MFRARVLVIDDDPFFRSIVATMLRKDYFVSIASEGAEGYYKALEHPPHLVVMDVKMPGWDGLQALKAFRGHPLLCHIPIVFLTIDAGKETVLAAIHAGANDYVIKSSFVKDEFLGKVQKQLSVVAGNGLAAPAAPQQAAHMPAPINSPHTALPGASRESRGLQTIIDEWE